MKQVTLELHLSSLKFGLDPMPLTLDLMGSFLVANLIHLPSLVSIVRARGVLEIMKIFQYDLQPRDLDLLTTWGSLLGRSLIHKQSLVEIELGVIEILKIF